MSNTFLFYGGLVIAGISLLLGILATVILSFSWKMLTNRLDMEYGKKRR